MTYLQAHQNVNLQANQKRRLAIQPASPLTLPNNMPTLAPTGPPNFIHDIPPTPSFNASPKPHLLHHQLPIVEDDEEREDYPTSRPTTTPRRSTRLISNRTHATSQDKPCTTSLASDSQMLPSTLSPAHSPSMPTSMPWSLTLKNTVAASSILSPRKPSHSTGS